MLITKKRVNDLGLTESRYDKWKYILTLQGRAIFLEVNHRFPIAAA
jgi:hypothetical protein